MLLDAENHLVLLLKALESARHRVAELEKAAITASKNLPLFSGLPSPDGQEAGSTSKLPNFLSDITADDAAMLSELLGMEGFYADMSNYLGSDDNPLSRPAIGDLPPPEIIPEETPPIDPSISDVIAEDGADIMGEDLFSGLQSPPSASTCAISNQNTLLPQVWYIQEEPAAQTHMPFTESRFLTVLSQSGAGLFQWDIDTNQVHVTAEWEVLLGKIDKNVAPMAALIQYIDSSDALALADAMENMVRGSLSVVRQTVKTTNRYGVVVWVDLHIFTQPKPGGRIQSIMGMARNVTKEKDKESLLYLHYQRYRSLAEQVPDFVCRLDRKGCILYASPTISGHILMPADTALGKNIAEFFKCDENNALMETLEEVFVTTQAKQKEIILHSSFLGNFSAACHFWPETGPVSLEKDGPRVTAVTVQVWDTTTPGRISENYKALFNRLMDGFILFRFQPATPSVEIQPGDFIAIAANPALGTMLQIDPAKSIGVSLATLTDQDAEQWAICLNQVILKNKPIVYYLRSRRLSILLEISAYSPGAGRVACIVKDVTSLHAIEQTIHLNEARFAALYRLSHMYDAPEEEVIQFSLDQAVQLTGSSVGHLMVLSGPTRKKSYWSREAMAKYGDVLTPVLTPELLAKHELNKNKPLHPVIMNLVSNKLITGNVSNLPIQRAMLAPVMEEGRVVCVAGVVNKQTDYEQADLRQLELFVNGMWFQMRRRWVVEALQVAKEQAELANQAKDIFLANVSHELRTPLNGMLGMLQLLQQSVLSQEQKEWVSVADYSGRSLVRIISDILNFSRIGAQRYTVEPQPFDFPSTVRSTLGIFVHQARQNNIAFSVVLDEAIPEYVEGDESLIRQTLLNIVGNAFKFTNKGSIRVECSVLAGKLDDTVNIYLGVHDTGIGIAEEDQVIVFKPFTQLDGSHTRRYSGVGLGLSIVQRLITMQNGSLCLESTLNRGTSVHLSLPFKIAKRPKQAVEKLVPSGQPLVSLHVLVAEDDPVNRLTIRTMLQKAGHTVVCVTNGLEALEALQVYPFDCLVTDIQMPVMDGEEVTRRIRSGEASATPPSEAMYILMDKQPDNTIVEVPEDLPIVALTAHVMDDMCQHLQETGIDHYLWKPLERKELIKTMRAVADLCQKRKQEQPSQ